MMEDAIALRLTFLSTMMCRSMERELSALNVTLTPLPMASLRSRCTSPSVTLDTENYRAKREDTLIRLANRMANRAVKMGRKVSLEPMNPYERRVIHSALQPNELVDTHSEGEEPKRHIVITLRK